MVHGDLFLHLSNPTPPVDSISSKKLSNEYSVTLRVEGGGKSRKRHDRSSNKRPLPILVPRELMFRDPCLSLYLRCDRVITLLVYEGLRSLEKRVSGRC